METIKLKTGASANIQLKGLATSGYKWTFTVDKEGIISVDQAMSTPAENDIKPGQSMDEIFTVKAIAPGNVTIHFVQKRSWEDDTAKLVNYKIEVS